MASSRTGSNSGQRKTSSGSRKSTSSRSTARRNNSSSRGRSAGRSYTSSRGNRKQSNPMDGALYNEVLLWILAAACLLLFLCNFGILGKAYVISKFFFGLFGLITFVLPILVFVFVLFWLGNAGSNVATRHLVAGVFLTIAIETFCDLIAGKWNKESVLVVSDIYNRCSETRLGGGVFGGILSYGLVKLLDVFGAVLVLLVIILICLIVITDRSLLSLIADAGKQSKDLHERGRVAREEMAREREDRRSKNRHSDSGRSGRRHHSFYDDDELLPFEESEQERLVREEREELARKNAASAKRHREQEAAEQLLRQRQQKEEDKKRRQDEKTQAKQERKVEKEQQREAARLEKERQVREEKEQKQTDDILRGGMIPIVDTTLTPKVPVNPTALRPKTSEFSHTIVLNQGMSGSGAFDSSGAGLAAAASDRLYESDPSAFFKRSSEYSDETRELCADLNKDHVDPFLNPDSPVGSEQPIVNPEPAETYGELKNVAPVSGENDRREPVVSEFEKQVLEGFDETMSTTSPWGQPVKAQTEYQPEQSSSVSQNVSDNDRINDEQINDERINEEQIIEERQQQDASMVATPSGTDNAFYGEGAANKAMSSYQTEIGNQMAVSNKENRPVATLSKTDDIPVHSGNQGELSVNHQPQEAATESAKPQKPYEFPSVDLLNRPKVSQNVDSEESLHETGLKLQQTMETFGVKVTVTGASRGPAVTRFEVTPAVGVKVSKIIQLENDIKLNLAATDIRIEAPIPGKAAVGIEVPNRENSAVYLRELIESKEFKDSNARLSFAVGKDLGGKVIVSDLAKMPHMLIAGSTGSGKSVCINTIIMSIIYKSTPDQVKLIMIDPKVVELSVYNGIPHLFDKVVTDPKQAAAMLHFCVKEMEVRYQKFAEFGVRDLAGYNKKVEAGGQEMEGQQVMPQILIIVDELADLMMVAQKDVEESICRLAQLARAAGIHLIIATQRPSVDVITGLIKANMPSRCAFAVSSGTDSRTILDMNGAEKLLGKGDMLFAPQGSPKPIRIQGAFVSDEEVQRVVDFLKEQQYDNKYAPNVELDLTRNPENTGSASSSNGTEAAQKSEESQYDEYLRQAGEFIIEKQKASIGMLQRMYKIGFNRAARIMDQLSEFGVVGPEEGTKPRKILMTLEQFYSFCDENGIN